MVYNCLFGTKINFTMLERVGIMGSLFIIIIIFSREKKKKERKKFVSLYPVKPGVLTGNPKVVPVPVRGDANRLSFLRTRTKKAKFHL